MKTTILDVNGMVEIVVEKETISHFALNANARILPSSCHKRKARCTGLSICLNPQPDDEKYCKIFSSNFNFCFIIFWSPQHPQNSPFNSFGVGNSYVISPLPINSETWKSFEKIYVVYCSREIIYFIEYLFISTSTCFFKFLWFMSSNR